MNIILCWICEGGRQWNCEQRSSFHRLSKLSSYIPLCIWKGYLLSSDFTFSLCQSFRIVDRNVGAPTIISLSFLRLISHLFVRTTCWRLFWPAFRLPTPYSFMGSICLNYFPLIVNFKSPFLFIISLLTILIWPLS